jgi:apolipoprotein N-acyltransferase
MPSGLRSRWQRAGVLAIGVASGMLIGLSIPPFGWWPLAWLGFAGLAATLPGTGLVERMLLGAGAGLGQYGLGLFWVHEFSILGWVLLTLVECAFWVAAAAAVPTGRRICVALGVPSAFVLAEWARDRYPLGGFPMGSVALGQASSPLAPSLRIGGSLLLSGVTVAAGVATAGSLHALRAWLEARARSAPHACRDVRRTTALVALAGAAVVSVVLVADASPSGAGGHAAPLTVGLVQGGGARGTRAIYTDPQTVFVRTLVASNALLGPLDLVVFPEGVLQSHIPYTQTVDAEDIAALARRTGATVLVGVEQDVGIRRYRNEIVAWSPDGRIIGSYEKNHLVPFGEYVPYRSLITKFVSIPQVPYDGIPGHGPGILRTPAGPLGIMVSFEVFFDGRARGAVRAGGEVLVVPTNTASYRSTQVPTQELAASRMRAWETGRWVLQVSTTGYTAVVSPRGRVVVRSSLGEEDVLQATVPAELGKTWFVQFGDAPTPIGALLVLGLGWYIGLGGYLGLDGYIRLGGHKGRRPSRPDPVSTEAAATGEPAPGTAHRS